MYLDASCSQVGRDAMKQILVAVTLVLAMTAVGRSQPLAFSSRGPGGGGALFLPSHDKGRSGVMAMACDMGQLFMTSNGGATWTTVDARQIQVSNSAGCVQFTADPTCMYAIDATTLNGSDTRRPSKSTDGGTTWTVIASDPTGGSAFSLYASYADPLKLVVADYSSMYFSADGGGSWRLIYRTRSASGIHVAGAVFLEGEIFIGLSTGVVYSNDGGAVFTHRRDLVGLDTATQAIFSFDAARSSTAASATLVAAVVASADVYGGVTALDRPAFQGLYVVAPGSTAWSKKSTGIAPGDVVHFVGMSDTNDRIMFAAGQASGGVPAVYRSLDGGGSWSQTFLADNNRNIRTGWSGFNGDRAWSYGEYALGFSVHGADPRKLVFTDLGFIHGSTDGGTSWSALTIDSSQLHPPGSATPTGISYRSNGCENSSWWHVVNVDSLVMIGCVSDIRAMRSTDGGVSWGFTCKGITENSLYHVVKHAQSGMLFGATSTVHDMYQSTYLQDARIDNGKGRVVVSTDKGASWSTSFDFGHPVVWLAADPTRASRMYASVIHSSQGGVYVCDDVGASVATTWTRLPAPPRTEGHPFACVVLADGTLVATYSGRRDTKGTFTPSSGVFVWSGSAWSDRSDSAMRYWTKDIVVDPADASGSTWYVTVFSGWGGAPNGLGGVYRTTDRGRTWQRVWKTDRAESVSMVSGSRAMYVTTESEGLWYTSDRLASPLDIRRVDAYPFRHPVRVAEGANPSELWVTSFGGGLRVSTTGTPARLEPPRLIVPKNDSQMTTRKVGCRWTRADGATRYRLQMSTDSSFVTAFRDTVLVDTARYLWMPGFGTYYWRVRGESAADTGSWSQIWRMNVPSSVPPAALLYPSCNATSVSMPVELRWKDMGSAYQFFLIVARDRLLKDVVLDTSMMGWNQRCLLSSLLPNTTYHWCVYGRGVEFGGEPSDTCSFTTGTVSGVAEGGSADGSVLPGALGSDVFVLGATAGTSYTCEVFTVLGQLIDRQVGECVADSRVTLSSQTRCSGLCVIIMYDGHGNVMGSARRLYGN